jgi:hypothetical protein
MGSKGRIRAGTSITTIVATSLVALTVLMPGVASAHGTVLSPQGEVAESSNCVIHTLAGVMRQGEFKQAGDVGDIVEVECNPAVFPGGTPVEISDSQLLSRCSLSGGTVTWLNPNEFNTGVAKTSTGRETIVELDGNGNANVALVAGPNCAVGDTVVSAHTQPGNGNTTVESFAAGFAVEPARPSPEGVTVTPSSQVEDEASSSVATLIQVESGSTEAKVRVAAPELFSRCEVAPHLTWLRPNGEVIVGVKELAGGTAIEPTELEALRTDDDGNAFVIALGTSSCKPGKSFFEVDLEESPFTTEEPSFTILPPQATAEPAFTIEKLQRIAGAGAGYTMETLTGTVGETVEYEIVVKNTASVATTFTNFTDAECDPGTVVGGPSGPVSQGASTTYKCTRALKVPGTVTNEAEVTGTTVGGTPKTAPSNVVKVTVSEPAKPSFTLEKLQRITGAFTTAPLMGTIGEVVEYEIVARNTGNVALTFGEIEDHFCEPGTVAGGPGGIPVGPGGTTTWTCTRTLPTEGTFENVASVSATPPGGAPVSETSQPVEVTVPAAGPGPGTSQFTVEKLQRIGAGSTFTLEDLHGTVGETVEYEIVVTNTGTTPLIVSTPDDPYCDAGTLAGGLGGASLEPGHATTYTCTRLLTTEGSFVNVATVAATPTPPGSPTIEQPSPPVKVNVPVTQTPAAVTAPATSPPPAGTPKVAVLAKCEATAPVVRGASGPKRGKFTVRVSAPGVKQITFYLDGHKLKTLHSSPAHPGHFTLKVNAGKLSTGAHRLSYTAVMENVNCAKAAGARLFVHPFSARVKPRFTG